MGTILLVGRRGAGPIINVALVVGLSTPHQQGISTLCSGTVTSNGSMVQLCDLRDSDSSSAAGSFPPLPSF